MPISKQRRLKQRENRRKKRYLFHILRLEGQCPELMTKEEIKNYFNLYYKNHGVVCNMNFEEWEKRWNKRPKVDAIFYRVPGSFESSN